MPDHTGHCHNPCEAWQRLGIWWSTLFLVENFGACVKDLWFCKLYIYNTLSRCSLKVNLKLKVTPRCIWELAVEAEDVLSFLIFCWKLFHWFSSSMSCVIEEVDVSSENSLTFDDKPSDKSNKKSCIQIN